MDKYIKYRDCLIRAIEEHDHSLVPVTHVYRATENSISCALCFMVSFRMINKIKIIPYYLEDHTLHTFAFIATAVEGDTDVVYLARCKVDEEAEALSEIELQITRSRGESGFWFEPADTYKYSIPFETPIAEEEKADYEELEMIGRAAFDPAVNPDILSDANCVLMETGSIVMESPAYIRVMNPMFVSEAPTRMIREPIPFGIHPGKPNDVDNKGRILAVDVERGLVLVAIDVDGFVSPYVVPDETSTVFAPGSLIEAHRRGMAKEVLDSQNTAMEMPASATTITLLKYKKGTLLGINQYSQIQAPGARSPWKYNN